MKLLDDRSSKMIYSPRTRAPRHAKSPEIRHCTPPVGATGPGGEALSDRARERAGELGSPPLVRRPASSARRRRSGYKADRTGHHPQAGQLPLTTGTALAEALQAKGDYERAVESHRTALRLWPDFPEAHCNLGTALQSLGRFEEAAASLRRAIELRPTFAVAVNNLGIVLRELGEDEEAVALFRRAADLEPGYAPARTNLGQALLNSGRAEEALSHCEEAARLDPESAEIHDNLGNVLRALDRLDEAWNAHWQALRINRTFAMANAHIGLIFCNAGGISGEARCPG